MRLVKKLLPALLPGAAAAALIIWLSQVILFNLGGIVRFFCGIAGVKEADADLFYRIFAQLQDAELASPWIPALLIGCGINALLAYLVHRGVIRNIIINAGIWLLVTIPAALWFTKVNGVMLGDMLRQLIPILESGLL